MPKAGRYDYPYRRLDDCIEYLRKANELTKQHSFTREAFASAIGQKATGGGFNLLVGSMAMYKLVDTGGGQVIYTELAKKILHGLGKDKEEAKAQATRNIILFADMYDKFGANPSMDELYHFLQEKANVDISEANRLAKEISKLFGPVATYLKGHAGPARPAKEGNKKKGINGQQKEAYRSDAWILISPYGKTKIKDRVSFLAAHTLLSALEEKYPKEDKSDK